MPTVLVTLNAREGKGVPDIKYVRKLNAKSLQDANNIAIDELKLAVPKCEVVDIEARVVAE